MSLEGAISALQAHAIEAGCQTAPSTPPEDLSGFPFSVSYEVSGDLFTQSADWGYDIATIAVDMHVNRSDLPTDVSTAYTLRLAFMQKLIGDPTLGNSVLSIEGQPHRDFGAMKYGKMDTIGYRWRIRVKYQFAGS